MHNASQTRERIDRAAIRLFVERGVDGTSIRQIAKEAGISVGALYNHYPSKEDMALTRYLATVDRGDNQHAENEIGI